MGGGRAGAASLMARARTPEGSTMSNTTLNAGSKRKLTRQDLREAAEKYKNWGKWGPQDEIGTLNYTAPEDIIAAADDMVTMPLQCGTQWDGLGHVFYENSMWNGYDCREVTSGGAQKCAIEKTKNKMVGRGVFLDVARALGKECLDDGYGIT